MLQTPVLFCIFNRPELTQQVFAAIRDARPEKLLICADGPRSTHPEDAPRVEQARSVVAQVDWPCELQTNFSPTNLGCRQRMASGIDWAFGLSEHLIVLEDDCLPSPQFFDFCQRMLDRFQQDPRVGMICGDQFLPNLECDTDAYFSRYPYVWGWASWRRAWQHYDLAMRHWPCRRDQKWIEGVTTGSAEAAYWSNIFENQHQGQIDTWDYSWIFNCWDQNLLSIHPKHNLVSNIGFGADATHTTDATNWLANLPAVSNPRSDVGSANPWSLPGRVAPCWERERQIFHQVYCPTSNEPSPVSSHRRPGWHRRWKKLTQWIRRRAA